MLTTETQKTILAADDSSVALALLSRMLKHEGYRVVTASNGIEAVQKVYAESPDLIILDIEMPRMNGYHVCRLLKRDPSVAHIPVIIVTAVDLRGTEFWSLRTGADAFLVKSEEPEELRALILSLLAHAQPRMQLEGEDKGFRAPVLGAEEILERVAALMDDELYAATIGRIEQKTILQNLQDGVLTLNVASEVTAANQALCEMLGQDESELLGRHFEEAIGEAAGPSTLSAFESVLAGREALEQETEIGHRSGRKTPVAISAVPLRDFLGAAVGCVCIFHNIAKRKENAELIDQLRSLDKVKNDLTHMIVHDLRTPLTSLLSGLHTLRPADDDREILAISISGGNTLLGMINDLLDISKMEEGKLVLETSWFSLNDLVGEALRQVEWLALDKSMQMSVQISQEAVRLRADENKLRRVIVNLLGNAIKFTPPHGEINISAQFDPASQEIEVCVRDSGEGIPEEALGRIFDKFVQVENRSAGKAMSTGLGLTFCKLVVEAHGGTIWAESTLGVGSTFRLKLPRLAPNEPLENLSEPSLSVG